MGMELLKENIEYENSQGENIADSVVRGDFVIPDTEPDVVKVLMVDARPIITEKEVMDDKIYLSGKIDYNVIYLAKEEDRYGAHNVAYSVKFADNIQLPGAAAGMSCYVDSYVEHIECSIVNERKIAIECIMKLMGEAYKNCEVEFVNGVGGNSEVQKLTKNTLINKSAGNYNCDLAPKSIIQIPMDKPQIGKVLKCDVRINKKDVKLLESKIAVECNANFCILYRAKDSEDLCYIEDNVVVNKEIDAENVRSNMDAENLFTLESMNFDVKEDDLGESRVVEAEALLNCNCKPIYKQEVEVVEDAYCPTMNLGISRKEYDVNVMQGQNVSQTIVKEDIEAEKPKEVVMACGKVCITEKKVLEDKVMIDGILSANVLYKNEDEEKPLDVITEEIPFSCSQDIPGCKIDMKCFAKVNVETLEAVVEGKNIAVKALIEVSCKVMYTTKKEFVVDISPVEGEAPKKKASLTIYVVQPGDSLWKVAKRYCTTVDDIVKANNIENPDSLIVGTKIIVPGRAVI